MTTVNLAPEWRPSQLPPGALRDAAVESWAAAARHDAEGHRPTRPEGRALALVLSAARRLGSTWPELAQWGDPMLAALNVFTLRRAPWDETIAEALAVLAERGGCEPDAESFARIVADEALREAKRRRP